MRQQIKCERANCYRDADYLTDERHPQEDGTVDVEHRATCEIHSRQELPQNITLLSASQIIQWSDRRCDA